MEILGLSSLPVEVLDEIFLKIQRPRDLASLCLASRGLAKSAFPLLYRDLTIQSTVDDAASFQRWTERLSHFCHNGHLRHSQIIKIGVPNEVMSVDHKSQLYMRDLLAKIPPNVLKRFEFGNYARPVSVSEYELLWTSQQHLENLQIDLSHLDDAADSPPSELLLAAIASSSKVSELALNFGHINNILHGRLVWLAAILSLHSISKISLSNVPWVIPTQSMAPLQLQQCFTVANQRVLKDLRLERVYITGADNHLSLDMFPCLDCLGLLHCVGVDAILNGFHHPKLTRLIFIGELTARRDIDPLPAFLERNSCLQSLVVDCHEVYIVDTVIGPLAEAIRHHSTTLKVLSVDIWEMELDRSPFLRSSISCTKISQLAICLPVMEIVHTCSILLMNLPHLRILQIFPRPKQNSKLSGYWFTQPQTYVAFTRFLAGQIFYEAPAQSQLSLLVFGRAYAPTEDHAGRKDDGTPNYSWRKQPARVQQLYVAPHVLGTRSVSRIDASEVKYLFPESEILDYVS